MQLIARLVIWFCILCIGLLITIPRSYAQQAVLEDVVYLKNGSIIRGTIIEQVPGESLKIETKDGNVFTFSEDEISRIAKEEMKGAILEELKKPIGNKKEPALAMVLSLLLPGTGQFYNGEYKKGAIQMGMFFGGAAIMFAFYPEEVLFGDHDSEFNGEDAIALLGGLIALGGYVWSATDAPKSASRINKENGWAFAPQISDNLYLTITDLQIDNEVTPGVKLLLKF